MNQKSSDKTTRDLRFLCHTGYILINYLVQAVPMTLLPISSDSCMLDFLTSRIFLFAPYRY